MTSIALARRLLRLVLPRHDRDMLVADLDEEFHRHVVPQRGVRAATWWYWRQTLTSLPAALRLRYRAWRRDETMTMQETEPLAAQLAQDVRYAWRGWRREPLFAATAIGTYALALAVAGAVGSVAYRVLVEPLPYAGADALVRVLEAARSGQFSYPDFLELQRSTRTLTDVVGFNGGSRTLTGHGPAERLASVDVTGGFFEALGVVPALGRSFHPADFPLQAPPVVIVTHAAWVRRFGGDPALVGRTVVLNGRPHAVVGVLPARFEFPLRGGTELWLPLRPSRAQLERGYFHWLDVIARRRAGVSDAQIAGDLEAIAGTLAAADPRFHGSARIRTMPLREEIVGYVRPSLTALLAAVVLLFVTACASVGGLVLARAAARTREISVRAAIGAAPARLARQFVVENVMLTLAGAAIGLAFAGPLVAAAMRGLPEPQKASLLRAGELGLTPEVAAAAIALSILAGLVFAVASMRRVRRGDLARALTLRTGAGVDGRWRALLIAGEIALALMLIAGTGLLARSVHRLLQVSPGFDPAGVLTFRLALPPARYPDAASVRAARERLLAAFRSLPGVTAVSTIDQLPLTGTGNNGTLQIVGRATASEGPLVLVRTVGEDYFDTIGLAVESGRSFSRSDREGTPLVAVVNRTLVDQVFGGSSPIGQRITFVFAPGPYEIIGVTGDEQFADLDRGRSPVVYFPFAQDGSSGFSVVIRGHRPQELAAGAVRALAAVDPELPAFAVRTMEQIVEQSRAVFLRKAVLSLLAVFAAGAMVLTAVGIYGTLAFAVTRRTREIGIRMALGARRAAVVRIMLGQAMLPVACGCAAGVLGSAALAGSLRALLFGIEPTDAATLTAAVALISVVALVSCAVPVWRALRIDPATALRDDGS